VERYERAVIELECLTKMPKVRFEGLTGLKRSQMTHMHQHYNLPYEGSPLNLIKLLVEYHRLVVGRSDEGDSKKMADARMAELKV